MALTTKQLEYQRVYRERHRARIAAQVRDRGAADRETYNAQRRAYSAKPETKALVLAARRASRLEKPAYWLWRAAKYRAKYTGLYFSLEVSDITVPAQCPVFGIPLAVGRAPGTGRDNSPTIDHINPSLGYTKDNIVIVSWLANRLKSNATPEQLARLAEFYNHAAMRND